MAGFEPGSSGGSVHGRATLAKLSFYWIFLGFFIFIFVLSKLTENQFSLKNSA